MTRDRRDISILQKIVNYCDEIDQTREHFGNTYELLLNTKIYQNAAAMCILQIGELVGHLSEDFRAAHPELPWRQIRTMRNIAAHDYENFSLKYLWDTMSDDIPGLRILFNGIISQSQEPPQDKPKEE